MWVAVKRSYGEVLMDKEAYFKELMETGLTQEEIAKIIEEAERRFNELMNEPIVGGPPISSGRWVGF